MRKLSNPALWLPLLVTAAALILLSFRFVLNMVGAIALIPALAVWLEQVL